MKVLILVALLAVVSATSPPENPAVYTAPVDPTYGAPAPEYTTAAYKSEPAQPYNFEWEVKDAESYNDYSHSKSSDGNVVTGSYRVALPDGRIQVVTYKADSYGYNADVQYIGEANYPEPATYSVPVYEAPVSVYEAPATAPVYEAPAPVSVYEAPATAPVYEVPSPAPVYKVVPAVLRVPAY